MRAARFIFGLGMAGSCLAAPQLHHALDATLQVPFLSADGLSRQMNVRGEFPGAPSGTVLFARVTVRAPSGAVVSLQELEQPLQRATRTDSAVAWPPPDRALKALPVSGFYEATLEATALEPWLSTRLGTSDRVDAALAQAPNGRIVQTWDFQVGDVPAPAMPAFAGFGRPGQPAMLKGATQYTAYLGNFHSQSNHSDGGGNVATCTSAQGAQNGQYAPADGFAFARAHGLDFLAVTDHNHYYDGNGSGTSANGSAAAAITLYQSGLQAAAQYAAQHPGFAPLYGMEWGVTTGGGHLNIFGSQQLWNWEYNNSGQLFGDLFTARSDYAALYATMRAAGVVGQFNHPDSSGQFVVNGVSLAYTTDGDEVMVLGEILNTSAFSNRVDEGETSQTIYQSPFNRLLEAGFHIAPATNQDNHCANWGASAPNRTAVLIPNGTPVTQASVIEALRARRVFATTDKASQISLTANGRMMGSRFENSGPLSLSVAFSSTSGATVSRVQIFAGVPRRNGTVTQLVEAATTTITPTIGEHFYYGKITLASGRLLWTAPVWVTQGEAGPVVDPVFANGFE